MFVWVYQESANQSLHWLCYRLQRNSEHKVRVTKKKKKTWTVTDNLHMILGWKCILLEQKSDLPFFFIAVLSYCEVLIKRSDWCVLQCECHFQLKVSFSSQQDAIFRETVSLQSSVRLCLSDGLLEKVDRVV